MEAESASRLEEELLSHASWLRALAQSLVRDHATADDLVQETWVAALRRPPRTRSNLRAWLGRVLKNVAYQRSRAEGRRGRREREVEEREPLATPGELAARLDTQRQLARLVAELAEPYRSTLLLRYYEGIEPTEIARRTDVPAGTVRGRVSEGLERLRKKLDAAHDGDRRTWTRALVAWLEPLVPTPPAPAPNPGISSLPLLRGLLGVKLFSLITGTAVVVLLAAAVAFHSWLTAPSGDAVVPHEPVAVTFREIELDGPDESGDARVPLAIATDAEEVEPEPAAPPTIFDAVLARILDDEGTPIVGAGLRCVSGTYSFTNPVATSGSDGRVRLPIDGRNVAGDEGTDLGFLIADPGHESAPRSATWRAGEDVHLGDIRLGPGGSIRGRVVDEEGAGLAEAWIKLTDELPSAIDLERQRRQERDWVNPHLLPAIRTDAEGNFLLEGVPTGFARLCAGREEYLASWSGPIEVRAGTESAGVELRLEKSDPRDRIAGIVVDPEGNPVPHARLHHRYRTLFSSGSGQTNTDGEGRFELSLGRRVDRDLRASDREGRWGDAVLEDVEPGTLDIVLQLVEPIRAPLFVTSRGGELTTFTVSVRAADHRNTFTWLPAVEPSDEGVTLALPREEFVVEVEAEGHDTTVIGPYHGDEAPTELRAELVPLPGVRGTVSANGGKVADARVSLWEVSRQRIEHNGFPITVETDARASTRSDSRGLFSITLRDEGTYRLRAEAEGFAPAELGPFKIDPRVGLGGVEILLRPGGAIEGFVLTAPGTEPAGTIVGINRGDAHAVTQRVGTDGRFRFERLIPGDWQVRIVEKEIDPGSSQSMSDGHRSPHVIEGDCRVFEGGTTRHDLGGGAEGCIVNGSLRLDGRAPGAWTARLVPDGQTSWDRGEHPAVVLDPDGGFLVRVNEPGRWQLLLAAPGDEGEVTRLAAPLDLVPGEQEFTLDLATGHLEIENLAPVPSRESGDVVLQVLVWKRGDLVALIPVVGDESRRCVVPHVPAGRLSFHRLEPRHFSGNAFETDDWPVLAEIDVEAGERAALTLP